MSDLAPQDMIEPPVFTVYGANWTANVPLDVYNMQFNKELQMFEAATRAIEIFYGIKVKGEFVNPHSIDIKMLPKCENEEPAIGPATLIHPKDGLPTEGEIFPTHVLLMNGGFCKQSIAMLASWNNEIQEAQKQQEVENNKLNPPIKKPRKTRKPKN